MIDSHCHIDLPAFDSDRDAVLQRAWSAGVTRIVVPGITDERFGLLANLCSRQQRLYPAFGLHPLFLDQHQQDALTRLESALSCYSPVAVGEIGIDLWGSRAESQRQIELFAAQLAIAANAGLPVLLHLRGRGVVDEAISLLKHYRFAHGGIAHAFSGSLQQAERLIDLGFLLGFGAQLTNRLAHRIRSVATVLPLDAIALESDAPDMSGPLHRGERNEPAWLAESLAALAALREIGVDECGSVTSRSVCRLLFQDDGQCGAAV